MYLSLSAMCIYHYLQKEVNGQLVNKGLSISKMKIFHLITTGESSATDIKNYMEFSYRMVVAVLNALEKKIKYYIDSKALLIAGVECVYITEKGCKKNTCHRTYL